MKWLKNLFRKKKVEPTYPTPEEVTAKVEEYKEFLSNITRDEKGRWITPDGDVSTMARLPILIEKKWEDTKGEILKQCKCAGGDKCACKKKN